MSKHFLLLFFILDIAFTPCYSALSNLDQTDHASLETIIKTLENVEIQIITPAVIKEIQSFLESQKIPLYQNSTSDVIFLNLSQIIENACRKEYASIQEILGMCVYFEKVMSKILTRSPSLNLTLGTPFMIFLILTGAFITSFKINRDQEFYNSDWIPISDTQFWEILLNKKSFDLIKDQCNIDEKFRAIIQSSETFEGKLNILTVLLKSCKKNSTFIDQIYAECLQNPKFRLHAYSYTCPQIEPPMSFKKKSQILDVFFDNTQEHAFIDHIYSTIPKMEIFITDTEKISFIQRHVYGGALLLIEQKFLKFINFDLYIDPDREFLPITKRILSLITQ